MRIREPLAKENTILALFSFLAASSVLFVSSRENLSVMVADAQTAAEILLLLLVFQGVYYIYFVIPKEKVPGTPAPDHTTVIRDENTYFITFAAIASSCVLVFSRLQHSGNFGSALTASSILAVLLGIQVVYVYRMGKKTERPA